jgi:hypothetical protein
LRLALQLFVGAHLSFLFRRCRKSGHKSYQLSASSLNPVAICSRVEAESGRLKADSCFSGWAARIRT